MEDKYLQIHRNLCSANWNNKVVIDAIDEDSYFSKNEDVRKRAYDVVSDRLNFVTGELYKPTNLCIDYIGNSEILYNINKVSLICHRIDELLFERQKQAVFNAASKGCVIVSAFVSQKERDIFHLLLRESFPVIEIVGHGFGPMYHPTGVSYDACKAGTLVQITPWKFTPYLERKLTRDMCLVMNQFARVISKVPDYWWN